MFFWTDEMEYRSCPAAPTPLDLAMVEPISTCFEDLEGCLEMLIMAYHLGIPCMLSGMMPTFWSLLAHCSSHADASLCSHSYRSCPDLIYQSRIRPE